MVKVNDSCVETMKAIIAGEKEGFVFRKESSGFRKVVVKPVGRNWSEALLFKGEDGNSYTIFEVVAAVCFNKYIKIRWLSCINKLLIELYLLNDRHRVEFEPGDPECFVDGYEGEFFGELILFCGKKAREWGLIYGYKVRFGLTKKGVRAAERLIAIREKNKGEWKEFRENIGAVLEQVDKKSYEQFNKVLISEVKAVSAVTQ